MRGEFAQRGRFLIAGVWNTAFGFGTFTVLQYSLGERLGYVTTLCAAQALAVVQAHACQRFLVWRSTRPYVRELARFSTVYGLLLVVNILALSLLVEGAGTPVIISQYCVGAALIVTSFFVQKYWTFAPAV